MQTAAGAGESSAMPTHGSYVVVCEGMLYKQKHAVSAPSVTRQIADAFGGTRSGWVKRYFTIHGAFLSYYRKRPDPDDAPAWSVLLEDILSVSSADGPGFVFRLVVPSRELYLQASSRHDLERWVAILARRVKMRHDRSHNSSRDTGVISAVSIADYGMYFLTVLPIPEHLL